MIPAFASTILQRALKKGGEVLLSHLGKSAEAKVKESISSVVTEADLASEQAILNILDGAPEMYNIISEEAGYLDRKSDYTWVVDPLDGTSNFAAGLPWFGVIIALFFRDTPVIGGMYLPTEQKLYLATGGEGATLNEKKLKLLPSLPLSDQLLSYSFDFSEDPGKTRSEMDIMARLSRSVRNIRSTNSLVDFCFLAEGKLGAALNQQTKIWDIAVPWLLIRELGGSVSDIDGEKIQFDLSPKALSQNYTIVSSCPGLHQKILDTIHSK